MKAPVMRSCHQLLPRISEIQVREMFQSSWTSWSSAIIEVETVERSHRITGSDQASWYRRVYSSKSAISSSGASSSSCSEPPRRSSMNSLTLGETSSA
jgi:hypothetical protein